MQYELLYVIISACLVAYYVIVELYGWRSWKRERDMLDELELFMGHVRHYYYRYGVVRRALQAATDRSRGEVREQCLVMCEILDSADRENDKRDYLSRDFHKYLKLLLSFICLIDEHGDCETAGESVFLDSLLQLRLEISEEKRHKENIRHRYMGLTMLAGLPILAVPYVSEWCIRTIPSLDKLYHSRGGSLFRMIILMITMIAHESVMLLKTKGLPDNSPIIRMICDLIRKLPNRVTVKCSTWLRRIDKPFVSSTERFAARLNESDRMTYWYCERFILTVMVFLYSFGACYLGELEAGADTHDIWGDAAISLIMCVVSYCLGYVRLWFRAYLTSYRIRDEVLQFQMLIRLQRRANGVEVYSLLQSMEAFADLLRPAICKCRCEMNISYTDALEELYMADEDAEFKKLVACLMTVDEVGISGAFEEIVADMTDLQASEKQRRQIALENGSLLGNIIAVVPGGLILIGYLLTPFVVRSLMMFGEYRDELMILMGN